MGPVWFEVRLSLCSQESRVVTFQSIRNSITQATEAISILTIHNVNINDSGYYTCSANGVERSLERSTLVIVHGKVQGMKPV